MTDTDTVHVSPRVSQQTSIDHRKVYHLTDNCTHVGPDYRTIDRERAESLGASLCRQCNPDHTRELGEYTRSLRDKINAGEIEV